MGLRGRKFVQPGPFAAVLELTTVRSPTCQTAQARGVNIHRRSVGTAKMNLARVARFRTSSVRHSEFDHPVCQQPKRPARSSIGRVRARERNHVRLLRTGEHWKRPFSGSLAEGCFEAFLHAPLANAVHVAMPASVAAATSASMRPSSALSKMRARITRLADG